MKNFLLVTNAAKTNGKENAEKIIQILERNGCRCTANLFTEPQSDGRYLFTKPELVPEDTEAILTLGGDGTFIHAAKDLVELGLPVMGVNYGTLGYLTEVDVDGFEDVLKSILKGDYHVEDRMLIYGEIEREGRIIHKDIALNDIVLNRSATMGVIDYDVRINGDFLNSYSADGMIISTPTGSTGYNLSAGGPVAHPTAEVMLATPICAHTLNSRTIVFSANVEIEIIIKARSSERKQIKMVSFDGEGEVALENGDIIRIRKADVFAKKLKVAKMSFVEHLGKKMR